MHAGNNRPRRTVAGLAISLTLCAYSGSSAAADRPAFASAWSGDTRGGIRLMPGSASSQAGGYRRAGVEIRLDPGWHTYWRYPGDAGVPPQFDFGQSANIAAVHVLWPAPHRIAEHGLFVIGYTNDVILPLRVAPQRRDQPVKLHLKLDYAICQNVCVPVQAIAELELAEGASELDAALAAAEGLVPKKRTLHQGKPTSIQSVRRDASRSQVVVDITAPADAPVDLFAEG